MKVYCGAGAPEMVMMLYYYCNMVIRKLSVVINFAVKVNSLQRTSVSCKELWPKMGIQLLLGKLHARQDHRRMDRHRDGLLQQVPVLCSTQMKLNLEWSVIGVSCQSTSGCGLTDALCGLSR